MVAKGPTPKITLSAVAAHAGVALSTASVVLSENSEYFRNFSPATIQRVRRSAQKLGYRANLFASGLSAKGSPLFFVVALRDIRHSLTTEKYLWSFDGDLLGGVIDVSTRAGVYPIIAMTRPDATELEARNLDRVINGGVFGSIVRAPCPVLEKSLRQRIRDNQPAVVIFPQSLSAWPSNAVDIDNVELGRHAGRLLARQGCRRWLIIRDQEDCEPHAGRISGFRAVAREAGAELNTVCSPEAMEARQAAAVIGAAFTRHRPEGVFAVSFRNSDAFLRACRKAGCKAGRDVLLVGCDCSMIPEAIVPRITSLEASWRDIGVAAMETLLRMRDTGQARVPNVLVNHQVFGGATCPTD